MDLWIYGYMDILWIYEYMDIWIFYGFKILENYGYGLDMEFNFWMRWIIDWTWIRIAIHPAPLVICMSLNHKHL